MQESSALGPLDGKRMPRWKSIHGIGDSLTFATELDPVLPSQPHDLNRYLRMAVLLWGKILIPETFLLHNARTGDLLLRDKCQFSSMSDALKTGSIVVSRNSHSWNTSFSAHRRESITTGNPLVVPGDTGERLASLLDDIVDDKHCWTYETIPRARLFPDRFEDALRRLLPAPQFQNAKKFFSRPEVAHANPGPRTTIDGWDGLSRGRVVAALPHFRVQHHKLCPSVEMAVREAYANNVLDSLSPLHDNQAALPVLASRSVFQTRDYAVRTDFDTQRALLSSLTAERVYHIDATKLLSLPWDDFVGLSEDDDRRQFQSSRFRAALASRRGDYRSFADAINESSKSLDRYLKKIEGELRGTDPLRVGGRVLGKRQASATRQILLEVVLGLPGELARWIYAAWSVYGDRSVENKKAQEQRDRSARLRMLLAQDFAPKDRGAPS